MSTKQNSYGRGLFALLIICIAIAWINKEFFENKPRTNPVKKEIVPPKTGREKLDSLVDVISIKHNVSKKTMCRIIACESSWRPKVRSTLKYSEKDIERNPHWGKVGEYEKSYGLVQIHLPSHPEVSKEQALDPNFAIEFLAENLADNQGWQWTCY